MLFVIKTLLISPLGAISKPAGVGVRLIHDCSRPVGNALNDHATLDCSHILFGLG